MNTEANERMPKIGALYCVLTTVRLHTMQKSSLDEQSVAEHTKPFCIGAQGAFFVPIKITKTYVATDPPSVYGSKYYYDVCGLIGETVAVFKSTSLGIHGLKEFFGDLEEVELENLK